MRSQREFARGHFVIELACAGFDGEFLPGQFVNLKCDNTQWGRLYRPFSVMRWKADARSIEVYYHVVGAGTEWLSNRKPGAQLPALLPLGNSFSVPGDAGNVVLVAGGVGVAPLIFLFEKLKADKHPARVRFLMGARNRESLCIPLLEEAGIDAGYSTDNGSFGHRGFITELLAPSIEAGGLDYIACCGPTVMMAAVQELARGRCRGEASLEERMACGIGACFGCVATIVEPDGAETRVTTCRNGPVLPIEKVVFCER